MLDVSYCKKLIWKEILHTTEAVEGENGLQKPKKAVKIVYYNLKLMEKMLFLKTKQNISEISVMLVHSRPKSSLFSVRRSFIDPLLQQRQLNEDQASSYTVAAINLPIFFANQLSSCLVCKLSGCLSQFHKN